MMMKRMCGVHKVAWALLIIGGLDWLFVGLFSKDAFELLGLGTTSLVARAVFVLIGVSTLAMLGSERCCLGSGASEIKTKMMGMMGACGCGSGKPRWRCCGGAEAAKIAGEPCPCGSGRAVKDCCMKDPGTHEAAKKAPAGPQ